ncbi:hypothetical protein BDF21DRAFT_403008 [Thamnidium elegans]|nr:hypothetical protein BDF21DRAFT_403008 [Thamnidium elegans]
MVANTHPGNSMFISSLLRTSSVAAACWDARWSTRNYRLLVREAMTLKDLETSASTVHEEADNKKLTKKLWVVSERSSVNKIKGSSTLSNGPNGKSSHCNRFQYGYGYGDSARVKFSGRQSDYSLSPIRSIQRSHNPNQAHNFLTQTLVPIQLNLSNFASVRSFAQSFLSLGITAPYSGQSRRLKLQASEQDSSKGPSRIIIVSSSGQSTFLPGTGLSFNGLNSDTKYSAMEVYGPVQAGTRSITPTSCGFKTQNVKSSLCASWMYCDKTRQTV